MPKEIKDLKVFLAQMQASKALDSNTKKEKKEKNQPRNKFQKRIIIKKSRNSKVTKFKLRTSKYLYTFKANKMEVIKKIMSSIPSEVNKIDLTKKKKKE